MNSKLAVNRNADGYLSIGKLVTAKKTALRHGVWFRALNKLERGVLDLTTRYVACIKSTKLATVVTAILEKLKLASESMMDCLARTVGLPLAQKTSLIAQKLGNSSAKKWATDISFAWFLAIMSSNK
jgi:hypothetical protein